MTSSAPSLFRVLVARKLGLDPHTATPDEVSAELGRQLEAKRTRAATAAQTREADYIAALAGEQPN